MHIETTEKKEEDLKIEEEIAKLHNSSPNSFEEVKEGCSMSTKPSSTELPDDLTESIAIVSYETRMALVLIMSLGHCMPGWRL